MTGSDSNSGLKSSQAKTPAVSNEQINSDFLRDRSFAFVGKLAGLSRRDAKKMVQDHGGRVFNASDSNVDVIIIGADELPINNQASLLDETTLDLAAEGKIRIISESVLWQELGLIDVQSALRSLFTPAMLAQLANVPLQTVRRWQRRGLIVPVRQVHRLPYYDFQQVANARRLAQLISQGESPRVIERKLTQLADFCADVGRPLSQLSVIVEGKNVLLRDDSGLVDAAGQKRIDFGAIEDHVGDLPEPTIRKLFVEEDSSAEIFERFSISDFEQTEHPRATGEFGVTLPNEISAENFENAELEDFLEIAMELEEAGESQKAIDVYRMMGLALGPRADVCFQIAELLYFNEEYEAARERYYMAIELDETFIEARANLGCVLLELGSLELAVSAFEGALEHHSDYPDVHFHLARALDQMKHFEKAEASWRRFLELAPSSPWAEEARIRLGLNR